MDEFDLIQIAARFRKLEDAAESADLYHAANQEHMKFTAEKVKLQSVRGTLDSALEACRDDMVAMQEQIRKARA